MKIFIGGLWPHATRKELQKLVDKALRRPWYMLHGSRGTLVGCNLMQMTEHNSGHVEYSGVIEVDPTRVGWELVEALDGAVVQGHTLRAHKWFPRKGLPDRRVSFLGGEKGAGVERRNAKDRRRHLSVHVVGQPQTKAVSGFERVHGA